MPTFRGLADKEEVFKLPSAILEAFWREPEGFVDGSRILEVRTAFVADGSPIKVTLKAKDVSVEKVEGKVYAGMFRKLVKVKDAASARVDFEVELPEHGLKACSGS